VLAAAFVSLFSDVAAENRVPGVWEILRLAARSK
jgi:hypothetical protein